MELFKLFPILILDSFSKVLPGFFFLLILQPFYLFQQNKVIELFSPQALSGDWLTWCKILLILLTSYLLGTITAIFSNFVEFNFLAKPIFKSLKQNPNQYLFTEDIPQQIHLGLSSFENFTIFIDHCRNYVYMNNATAAGMLEKYRTLYRLSFGLILLLASIVILSASSLISLTLSQWILLLLFVPLSAIATFSISKRYILKTIQYYTMTKTCLGINQAEPAAK